MKIKKLLALLLVMSMVVSIMPIATFADNQTEESVGTSAQDSSDAEGDGATETPAGDGTTETPAGDGTTETPAGDGTTETPAGDGATETPAGDGTTETPAGDGTTETPAGDGTTETPAGDGTTETPAGDGTTETPAGDGTTETPAGDGTTETPAGDGTTETPAGDGTTETPAGDGTTETPVGEETPPPLEALPPQPNALYDGMTLEELYAYANAFSEEDDASAYLEKMQEEDPEVFEQLLTYVESLREEETPETVDFTDVGPFCDPVDLSALQRKCTPLLAKNLPMKTRSLPRDTQLPEGLKLSKKAQLNEDGSYQITMEAWATGEVITSQVPKPVDIILVLDQSGSMADGFNGYSSNYDNSRQKAMKDSVVNFINKVETKAVGMPAGTEHRIAVVTFSDSASTLLNFQSNYTALKNGINTLPNSPAGCTNTGAGMQKAYSILNGDTTVGLRQKVVILFTDGKPTEGYDDFTIDVADKAVKAAKDIKEKGATIYTVGIFDGANAEETDEDYRFRFFGWHYRFSEAAAANRVMNYASSNFRKARCTGLERCAGIKEKSNFTKPDRTASNYYLTASDAGTLDTIFQNITQNVDIPGITLGADAEVKDFMSEYFVVDQTSVQVSTSAYKGNGNWDTFAPPPASVNSNEESDRVSVTGFDFSGNFVSETEKSDGTFGQKLIITLDVTKKPGFFGGNHVPTNQSDSGIYQPNEQTPLGNFPQPTVDVKIDYEIDSQDQAIYLGNKADLTQLLKYKPEYKPDGRNNDYVKIKYDLKQGGTDVGAFDIPAGSNSDSVSWTWANEQTETLVLAGDTKYTLSCTVTPADSPIDPENPAQNPAITAQTPTVYVYKPQLTIAVSDVWADYQTTVNLAEWALGDGTKMAVDYKPSLNANWVASTGAENVPIIGDKPTIDKFSGFTYDFAKCETGGDAELDSGSATTGKKDTDFTVALTNFKINGNQVVATPEAVSTGYPNDKGYFTLHTNLFNLKITKKDDAPGAYGAQSFLFRLTNEQGDLDLSFSLARGMDSDLSMNKTVDDLLCGQSYVSECGDWSWRYHDEEKTLENTATSHAEPSKSDPGTEDQVLNFENTLQKFKWLTGSDGKANIFGIDYA